MAKQKTHIPRGSEVAVLTINGRLVTHRYSLCGKLDSKVTMISKNDVVDSATCKSCQRADDALVIRNHRRECRESGIDPDTMEPLRKKTS